MDKPIALITGANKGIGLEVARELSGSGFDVIMGVRDLKKGAYDFGTLLEIDVSDSKSVDRAAKEFGKKFPRLDVLINNAAILLDEDATLLETKDDTILRTLQTNTLGPITVTRAFGSYLLKSSQPRVINVSSGAGSLTNMTGYAPAYSISKAALNAVTKQLSSAFQGKVAVNSVCPGWVRTDMGGSSAPRSVKEGAAGIVWLATKASSSLTGKFFRDGKEVDW